jgi:tRNA(adenine34) deaminase
MLEVYTDEYFMKAALLEARQAYEEGEVPVGAVIVSNNRILAKGHNSTELLTDVTAHAEMITITAASQYLGAKYLQECTLYVTLEPCIMCAGALRWAQLGRVVYGASDEKQGFMRYGKELLHPKTKLEYGVLHDACQALIQDFFREKRMARI